MRSTSRVSTAGVGADQRDGQHREQRPPDRRGGVQDDRDPGQTDHERAGEREPDPRQGRGEGPCPRDAGTPAELHLQHDREDAAGQVLTELADEEDAARLSRPQG